MGRSWDTGLHLHTNTIQRIEIFSKVEEILKPHTQELAVPLVKKGCNFYSLGIVSLALNTISSSFESFADAWMCNCCLWTVLQALKGDIQTFVY